MIYIYIYTLIYPLLPFLFYLFYRSLYSVSMCRYSKRIRKKYSSRKARHWRSGKYNKRTRCVSQELWSQLVMTGSTHETHHHLSLSLSYSFSPLLLPLSSIHTDDDGVERWARLMRHGMACFITLGSLHAHVTCSRSLLENEEIKGSDEAHRQTERRWRNYITSKSILLFAACIRTFLSHALLHSSQTDSLLLNHIYIYIYIESMFRIVASHFRMRVPQNKSRRSWTSQLSSSFNFKSNDTNDEDEYGLSLLSSHSRCYYNYEDGHDRNTSMEIPKESNDSDTGSVSENEMSCRVCVSLV